MEFEIQYHKGNDVQILKHVSTERTMKTYRIKYAEAVTNIYEKEIQARNEKEARSYFIGDYSEKDIIDKVDGGYSEFLECEEIKE